MAGLENCAVLVGVWEDHGVVNVVVVNVVVVVKSPCSFMDRGGDFLWTWHGVGRRNRQNIPQGMKGICCNQSDRGASQLATDASLAMLLWARAMLLWWNIAIAGYSACGFPKPCDRGRRQRLTTCVPTK